MTGNREMEDDKRPNKGQIHPDVEKKILQAIGAIRFGSVEVVIHDSEVVQIEKKEKVRFDANQR